MKERRILKENKLPGTEKLTRPEEISIMSKYLGELKKGVEELTDNKFYSDITGTGLDYIPGVTTGLLKEINELPNTSDKLVDAVYEIDELENYKETLHDALSEINLDNTKVNLDNTTATKISALEQHIENLETSEKISELSDYKETLETESKVTELNDYKENLETSEKISDLSNYKENLETESKVSELSDYKENLETKEKISGLSDYREDLETKEKVSNLSDYRENLEAQEKVSNLSDYKENLETSEKISDLSNYREDLEVESKVSDLSDYKEDLQAESKVSDLSNYREDLEIESKVSLSDYKEDLSVDSKISDLSDYKENLETEEKVSDLGNYIDNLNAESKVSELGSYIDKIKQESKVSELSDYKENLNPEDKVDKLSDVVEKLNSESKVEKLEDYKENISDTRNVTLDNTREDLKNITETSSLSQYKDELDTEEKVSELSDFIDDLDVEDKVSDLSNYKENLQTESKVSDLGDHKEILANSEKDVELNNQAVELEGDKKSIEGLGDELLGVPEDNSKDSNHNYWDNSAEGNELYNIALQPDRDNSADPNHNYWDNTAEGNELYDVAIQAPENKNGSDISLETERIDLNIDKERVPENMEQPILSEKGFYDTEGVSEIRRKVLESIDLSDEEAFKRLIEMLECSPEPWEKKVASVVSTYLSRKIIDVDGAKDFEDSILAMLEIGIAGKGLEKRPEHTNKNGQSTFENADEIKDARSKLKAYESAKIPEYQLTNSSGILGSLNLNNYLRWAAENVLGKVKVHGQLRRKLIDETLALLVIAREQVEKAAKSNRDRLPGNDAGLITSAIQGGAIGAIDSTINNAYSSLQNLMSGTTVNHDTPVNRPNKDGSNSYEVGNTRNSKADGGGGFKSALKSAADSFLKKTVGGKSDTEYYFDNYWNCAGVRTTIQDLCLASPLTRSSTVQELFDILKTSPYITTPMKFGTIEKGAYGTYSLDTNAYWEIVFRPFLCDTGSCSNGGFSFLPSFAEMNLENEILHNAHTCYSEWIPVSNFELQKSKLTTKSLQLYDGEINYPVSVEFTNELRLTFVDDIYKTWRRYFEKCMEVSVFSSEAHTEEYYESTKLITPTVIDKETPCVAFYKNIVFQVTIYILTPQYSTIKKFDLLCVLKEFSEDYIGEIDGSGADLNVSFSIVGENPIYGDNVVDNRHKTTTIAKVEKNRKNTLETLKTAKKNTSLIKLL